MKKKIFKKISTIVFILSLIMTTNVFATTPTIVTGTVDLLTAATGWLTIIIPVGCGLFLGWQAFLKSMASDEAEKTAKNKLMKNVLIGGIIATSATGLVTAILNFY